jgi:NhaP-type Na+/H+ or K+/H+ antiporter
VIAVVVYGLYGAATYQYGLSSKGLRTGSFFKFFDVLSFMLNAMVFFYVGSSISNFFLRCAQVLLLARGSVTPTLPAGSACHACIVIADTF